MNDISNAVNLICWLCWPLSCYLWYKTGLRKGLNAADHLTQQRILQERIKGWNDCAEDVTRKLREAGIEVVENKIEAEDAARTVH